MAKNAEIKTTVNNASVTAFLKKVDDEQKRKDSFEIIKIMQQVSKEKPKMWGPSIVGFGSLHYKYESGREGDSCHVSLASNKNYISLYVCATDDDGYIAERYKDQLPKASIGKSCVRFKKLADVDEKALKKLIKEGAAIAAKV